MSVSSGPLTAPLARMRGATAAGSMTRMRYVSRVPGPCIGIVKFSSAPPPVASAMRKALMDDDRPTRFLERCPAPRPAPALLRAPSRQKPNAQRDRHPQDQGARPNHRPRHHERVRITRRARQCDADLQLARARAGTVHARREVLGERGALDQGELAVQFRIDLHEPLVVDGLSHQSSSRTRYRSARRCIQRTANASINDRQTRFHMPYFVAPCRRGRWPTATSVTLPPCILSVSSVPSVEPSSTTITS